MRWFASTVLGLGVLMSGLMPSIDTVGTHSVAFTSISGIRLNSFEARMITLVNGARSSAGVPQLAIKPGLTDLARKWSYTQSGVDTMKHNPNLRGDLSTYGSRGWQYGAENVGVGPSSDPDLLFRAFMASPGHKRNILDAHSKVLGLGSVEVNSAGNGLVTYVTMDFADYYSSSYGSSRVAAPGLKRDAWRPDSAHKIQIMRDHDQRVDASVVGGVINGLVSSTHVLSGLASVVALTDGGKAGLSRLTFHEALSLVPGTHLNLKLAAQSRTGRATHATVYFRNPAAGLTSSRTGVDLDGYPTTVSFTMPSGWSMPITEIVVEVNRDALVALAPVQGDRYVRLLLLGVTTG